MVCSRINFAQCFVSVLVLLFSLSSWIAVNGIWVELPLLVQMGVPEQFKLASWLVVIIQLANLGPLTFTIFNFMLKNNKKTEIYANYFILAVGSVACILLVFLWEKYSVWTNIDGKLHSTALMLLTFCVALVDCTSSVTFAPFISRFKKVYIIWFFIGEASSSFVPSVLALLQGVGRTTSILNSSYLIKKEDIVLNCTDWVEVAIKPRFGPDVFFAFLFILMVMSWLSHLLLNMKVIVRNEHEQLPGSVRMIHDEDQRPLIPENSQSSIQNSHGKMYGSTSRSQFNKRAITINYKSKIEIYFLLLLVAFLNCLSNGVLSSIQSFSTSAYGLETYSLSTAITSMVSPIATVLVYLKPQRNTAVVIFTTVIGLLFSGYCFVTAVTNASPPLQASVLGKFLVVFSWIMVSASFTYTTATIGWIFRNQPNSRHLLRWQGGVTQIGSFVGAVVMFVIVNYTSAFTPEIKDTRDWEPICHVVNGA